jgi:hypothetical protein
MLRTAWWLGGQGLHSLARLAKVDCTVELESARRLRIKQYPTLLWWKLGPSWELLEAGSELGAAPEAAERFEGLPSVDALLGFIRGQKPLAGQQAAKGQDVGFAHTGGVLVLDARSFDRESELLPAACCLLACLLACLPACAVALTVRACCVLNNGACACHPVRCAEALSDHAVMMVKFAAPWCEHCKQLLPVYGQAATLLEQEGSTAALAVLDASKEDAAHLANRYDIRCGYSTTHAVRIATLAMHVGRRAF